jgi:4-amino-4-deoxy-L-arabinose transferase-like glycosyltransferase
MRNIAFGLLAAAVIYVCFFHGLWNLGLVGPDEPRYAAVAREMYESGDWVTPRLWGQPWLEKPVLYYWAAAMRFRILGVNEFAARVPSAQTATLLTLALAWLAWRLYGGTAGRAMLLLFPTSVGAFGFARAATTDMIFSATLGLAMICAARLVGFPADSRPPRYWLMLFGAALGMATLAKGPAAIVLAGGSVGVWVLVTQKWRETFRLVYPSAVITFSVVALPWYVLCAMRNPDFIQVFLLSHNIDRFLTPVFRHGQPWWFYGPILLLGLLPWALLLAGVARDGWRRVREGTWRDSSGFFWVCWALFPLVFFSISKSKLPGYILPALAPLALLMARTLSRAIDEKTSAARWMLSGVGLTFVGLAASAGYWARRLPADAHLGEPSLLLTWAAVLAACGIVILLLSLLGRVRLALMAAAIVQAGLVLAIVTVALPQLDRHVSPRTAYLVGRDLDAAGQTLTAYKLHRAWQYGLNFYFQRKLPEWDPATGGAAWVYMSLDGLRELERAGVRILEARIVSRQALLVHVEPGQK